MTKPTKWVCVQRRLRSAWATAQTDQSSLCTQWVAKDPSFLHADSEDSDQTGQMPRLIWVFAGRTAILMVLSCRGTLYCLSFPVINIACVRSFPIVDGILVRQSRGCWNAWYPSILIGANNHLATNGHQRYRLVLTVTDVQQQYQLVTIITISSSHQLYRLVAKLAPIV